MPANQKQAIVSEKAPQPIGPYNPGIRVGNMIFCSGQAGIDRATGELVSGGVEAETRQTLRNLQFVLEAAGSGMGNIVKTTVFLREMADFPRMNAVYTEFFKDTPPARSTVAVAGLPKNALVEIEAIAVVTSE
jgi:2-iminobutanoate/2-iminopropanoate deaminase